LQFIHRYVFAVGFANTKRYDMIALLPQTVPKAHYNLAKPIITLNSPQAIITGDLLCGRHANRRLPYYIIHASAARSHASVMRSRPRKESSHSQQIPSVP